MKEYTVQMLANVKKVFEVKAENEEKAKETIEYILCSGQMDIDPLDIVSVGIDVIGEKDIDEDKV